MMPFGFPFNRQNQGLSQMMGMVKDAKNPQALLDRMMQNNPQLQGVMDLVKQAGGDPKKAFYQLAQQKGVDPNTILDMLK